MSKVLIEKVEKVEQLAKSIFRMTIKSDYVSGMQDLANLSM